MRNSIQDFSLANPIYVGATVTVWTVSAGVKTATKATLYAGATGTTTLSNPQSLDSDGKFQQPVYIDDPVIMTVSGLSIADHDTGIVQSVLAAGQLSSVYEDLAADDGVLLVGNAADKRDLASTAGGEGAALVGVQDAGGFFPASVTQAEQALQQLGANTIVSLRDPRFGAAFDGVTDDAAEINAAITAVRSLTAGAAQPLNGAPGTSRIASPLVVDSGLNLDLRGLTLLAAIAGDYAIKVNPITAAENKSFALRNGAIKWDGAFDTSTAKGVWLKGTLAPVIENMQFWGLGGHVLNAEFVANLSFKSNIVREHLGSDMIVLANVGGGTNEPYLVGITDNFLSYTASHDLTHVIINASNTWNLDILRNAIEIAGEGIRLAAMRGSCRVASNFIEGCMTGIRILNSGNARIEIAANTIVGTLPGGGIAAGSKGVDTGGATNCAYISILGGNIVGVETGIIFTHACLGWDVRDVVFDENVTTKVSGYPAMVQQDTQLDISSKIVQRCAATQGWVEAFDPSGTGVISAVSPGYLQPSALNIVTTGDQARYSYTLPAALDLSAYDYFVVPIWFNDYTKVKGHTSNDPAASFEMLQLWTGGSRYGVKLNSLSKPDNPLLQRSGEWMLASIPKTLFTATGTPDWAAIDAVHINASAPAANTVNMRFGGIFAMKLNGAHAGVKRFDVFADRTLFGSATYNPASLADGAGATTTVTVTGAALGDFVTAVSFSNDLQGVTLTGWISAADTVSVRFQNESGGVLDLASGLLRVQVKQGD